MPAILGGLPRLFPRRLTVLKPQAPGEFVRIPRAILQWVFVQILDQNSPKFLRWDLSITKCCLATGEPRCVSLHLVYTRSSAAASFWPLFRSLLLNAVDKGFDVVVAGGGHNGLKVTAAYLARAGRRVLVLEARELVGGCAGHRRNLARPIA